MEMVEPTFGSPQYSAVKNMFPGTRWALGSYCERLVSWRTKMIKGGILWLLGVPLIAVIALAVFHVI
jgi:hypothetical protein